MFDQSNKRYDKDTIPDVLNYLNIHLTNDLFVQLDLELLKNLKVSDKFLEKQRDFFNDHNYYVNNSSKFLKFKNALLDNIRKKSPLNYGTDERQAPLNRLLIYRNKVVAHQERMSVKTLKEQLRSLPSLEQMNEIAVWGYNFCLFVNYLYYRNSDLPSYYPHAAGATRDAIKDFLKGQNHFRNKLTTFLCHI